MEIDLKQDGLFREVLQSIEAEDRARKRRDGIEKPTFYACPECYHITESYEPLLKCGSCSWQGDLGEASSKENAEKIVLKYQAPGYNKLLGKNAETEELPATPRYTATSRYTSRSWGLYDSITNTLCEQIDPWIYLCNSNGVLSLAKVEIEKEGTGKAEKILRKYIVVNKVSYDLPLKIWKVRDFYYVPTLSKCNEFVAGRYTIRPLLEILSDVQKRIDLLFDFAFPRDVELWKLFIVQTWLKPALHEFYYFGIDATKGGGKTTLLEIMRLLCRHGYLGGDVSAASLPRLVEELDLSLFLDEIDQRLGTGEDDSANILRKGQRRGNKYVRVNKHTMVPEQFDVAGTHAFSYRSELEDAFMSRSISGHTATSKDNRLPVLNVYKDALLADLQEELFFWYVANLPALASSLQQVATRLSSVVATCSSCSDLYGQSTVNSTRAKLYEELLSDYTEEQRKVLDSLLGRNAELGYLLIQECRVVGLDLAPIVKITLEDKQKDELAGSSILIDLLRELLLETYQRLANASLTERWQLADGINAGCNYTTKSGLYAEFCLRLKEQNLSTIGSKKFSSLLKDVGFMQGVSITTQRTPNRGYPKPCLVFTDEILLTLGVSVATKQNISVPDEAIKRKKPQIRGVQDVPIVIRELGEVSREELVEYCTVENARSLVEWALDFYKERGNIYEAKPGRWRVNI